MSATAQARALVDGLIAAGVTDAVLAPGSRSAPLALALAAAEREGSLRLHVRIDERSAGYLALGLARGSGRAVPVVTTSGTAAVNLHPAVVEASYGGVPLVALTADRPPALRGVGANQTIDQVDLFGSAPRWSVDVADPGGDHAGDLQGLVAHAVGVATDPLFPGPVHLNLPYAEPLVEPWPERPESLAGPPVLAPTTRADVAVARLEPLIAGADARRGLIVVGDLGGMEYLVPDVVRLSDVTGWPIVPEPSAGLGAVPGVLDHGPLLLGDADFLAQAHPDVVITVGRVGLHRTVSRLLSRVSCHIVVDPRPEGYRCDPTRTASHLLGAVPQGPVEVDPTWLDRWQRADAAIAERIDAALGDRLSGPLVARSVVAELTASDLLVVGPSFPVRHVSCYAAAIPGRCIANRGTSGIDGVVSTAWGAALAHGGFTLALLGDLTALYDRNGLLAPSGERRPDLVYVVADNDGGGIFSSLEQGAPEYAADFERVFGTPHGGRLTEVLAAPGVTVTEVATAAELDAEVAAARAGGGVSIIVARCVDRATETALVRHLANP